MHVRGWPSGVDPELRGLFLPKVLGLIILANNS